MDVAIEGEHFVVWESNNVVFSKITQKDIHFVRCLEATLTVTIFRFGHRAGILNYYQFLAENKQAFHQLWATLIDWLDVPQ